MVTDYLFALITQPQVFDYYKTTLLHDSHIPTISRLHLGDWKGCFLWVGEESETTCDLTRLRRTNLFHNSFFIYGQL